MSMRKYGGAIFLASVAALLVLVSRQSLNGYFLPEEIDRLAMRATWPTYDLWFRLVSPFPLRADQRALDDLVLLGWFRLWKLDFRWYAGCMLALHATALCLIWRAARDLGARFASAAAAMLALAILPLILDAFWRPLWLGQLLCGVLLAAALAGHVRGRQVLCAAAFWLAMKCAPMALLFPAALAVAEMASGRREWKRLAPSLVIAGGFGIQLLVINPVAPQDTAAALRGAEFYPLLVMAWAFLAVSMNRVRWYALSACVVLWLPWSFGHLRIYRAATLARTRDSRLYFTSLAPQAGALRDADPVLLEGLPSSVLDWSVGRALHAWNGYREFKLELVLPGRQVPPGGAILRWDRSQGHVTVVR